MASAFMSIQRLLSHGIVDTTAANSIMTSMLHLSENGSSPQSTGWFFNSSPASSMLAETGNYDELSSSNGSTANGSTQLSAKYNDSVRLLQTLLILISSSNALKERPLASAFSLCFRLKSHVEPVIRSTASATIRQCCLALFERVCTEDKMTNGKSVSKRFNIPDDEDAAGNEQDTIVYAERFVKHFF